MPTPVMGPQVRQTSNSSMSSMGATPSGFWDTSNGLPTWQSSVGHYGGNGAWIAPTVLPPNSGNPTPYSLNGQTVNPADQVSDWIKGAGVGSGMSDLEVKSLVERAQAGDATAKQQAISMGIDPQHFVHKDMGHGFMDTVTDYIKQYAAPLGMAALTFGSGAFVGGAAGAGGGSLTPAEQASILGTNSADFGASGYGGVLGATSETAPLTATEAASVSGGGTAAADFGASGGGGVLGAAPTSAPLANAGGVATPAQSFAALTQPAHPSLFSSIGSFFNGAGGGGAGAFGGGVGGVGNALMLGSGLYGIYESEQQRKLAKQMAAQQDPFGPQRKQYADQLAALNADPSSVTKLPGYQFGMDQGNQSLLRTMASTGYTGSGNESIALQKYGQQYAGMYLQQEQARLAGLAGAQFAPNGGAVGLTGNMQANDIMSRALATLGYGFGKYNWGG